MIDDEEARENFMKDICTFLRKFSRIPFGVTPKVILIAWERFGKIKDALTDEQYQQEDIQELMSKLLEDVRNISEELSEYINCPSWNRPIFYDNDDDEYTIIYSKPKAITPDLPIEEPDNSLSMGDEHLDTIPSVENLVPIPSEFKGISEDTCDVPVCDDSSIFDALSDHSEILSDSNNDDTSSDDDDFEDIEYVSLEEVNDVDQEEKEFDLEDILQIQDVILREKLLNINRLIANIESLNDNTTPDHVLNSPSPFPIPDSNSFFEKSDYMSLLYSDNSFRHSSLFSDHTGKNGVVAVPLFLLITLFPEIPQDHEDQCLFSILQSPGLQSSAYFGILNPDHNLKKSERTKNKESKEFLIHFKESCASVIKKAKRRERANAKKKRRGVRSERKKKECLKTKNSLSKASTRSRRSRIDPSLKGFKVFCKTISLGDMQRIPRNSLDFLKSTSFYDNIYNWIFGDIGIKEFDTPIKPTLKLKEETPRYFYDGSMDNGEDIIPLMRISKETESNDAKECEISIKGNSMESKFKGFENVLFEQNEEFSSYDESSSKVENKFDTFKCFSNPLFELDEEIITLEKDVFQNEVISNQRKINDTCEIGGRLKFFDDLLNENPLPPDVSNVENDFQDNKEEIDISCDMIPPGIDTDDDSEGDVPPFEEPLDDVLFPLPKVDILPIEVEPVEVMFNDSHTYGENISQVEREFLSMVDELLNLSNDDETFDPGGGENDVLLNNGENNDLNVFRILEDSWFNIVKNKAMTQCHDGLQFSLHKERILKSKRAKTDKKRKRQEQERDLRKVIKAGSARQQEKTKDVKIRKLVYKEEKEDSKYKG
ncbi:hypothetical protein Tco_1449666 [Tanacetum coccineum]